MNAIKIEGSKKGNFAISPDPFQIGSYILGLTILPALAMIAIFAAAKKLLSMIPKKNAIKGKGKEKVSPLSGMIGLALPFLIAAALVIFDLTKPTDLKYDSPYNVFLMVLWLAAFPLLYLWVSFSFAKMHKNSMLHGVGAAVLLGALILAVEFAGLSMKAEVANGAILDFVCSLPLTIFHTILMGIAGAKLAEKI